MYYLFIYLYLFTKGKITVNVWTKSILVRVSMRFELARVRIIGIHLLSQGKSLVSSEGGNFFQRYCLAIVFHPISNNFPGPSETMNICLTVETVCGFICKIRLSLYTYGYVKIERHTIVNLLGGVGD